MFSGLYTPETESTLVELMNDVIENDGEDFSVFTTVTPNSAALEVIEWDDSSLDLFDEDSLINGAALDDLVLE